MISHNAHMLRLGFVTLFPEQINGWLSHSMTARAQASGCVTVMTSNPRDFTNDPHRTVDDRPYGGGPGMVMKAEPVSQAINQLNIPGGAVVFTDPTGMKFQQSDAEELSKFEQVLFVCGHYEGIDDRVRASHATHVFSIGDYVLTGGELPALVMADSIIRLIPGVLGAAESLEIDSHSDSLLSAPQFTKPADWNGVQVPDVLTSGDHGAVAKWKRIQSLQLTRTRRPDLFCRANLDKKDLDMLFSMARQANDSFEA